MMRLGVGVVRGTSPLAKLIDKASTLPWSGVSGRVLKSGTATHAFVWLIDSDGYAWRLDEEPPFANFCPDQPRDKSVEARWEITMDEQAIRSGIAMARSLYGTAYDFAEMAQQLLPGGGKGVRGAMICTAATMRVLAACGDDARDLVDCVMSGYPEALAAELVSAEGEPWLKRVG